MKARAVTVCAAMTLAAVVLLSADVANLDPGRMRRLGQVDGQKDLHRS